MTKKHAVVSALTSFSGVVILLIMPLFSFAQEVNQVENGRQVEALTSYFPDKVGMSWTYSGSVANTLMKIKAYRNITTIKGLKQVDGVPAVMVTESNQGNKGPSTSYFSTGDLGIVYHGGEPTSDFENQLIPYAVIPFPMRFGETFVQLEKENLDFGLDFDHDGSKEIAGVKASVLAESYERISVPAGVYEQALKLKGIMIIRLRLSGSPSGEVLEIVDRTTTWLVPGIGMVKGIEVIEFPAVGALPATRTVTTELLTAFSETPASSQ